MSQAHGLESGGRGQGENTGESLYHGMFCSNGRDRSLNNCTRLVAQGLFLVAKCAALV